MTPPHDPARLVPRLRIAVICAAGLEAISGVVLIAWSRSDRVAFRFDPRPWVRQQITGIEPLGAIGSLQLLALLVAGLLWLAWQYDATDALWRGGRPGVVRRPGTAILWWFIPFANLVMPLLAMRELHRVSGGPDAPRHDTWFFFWWAGLVVGGLLGACSTLAGLITPFTHGPAGQAPTIVTFEDAAGAWIAAGIGYLLFAASSIPALAIVHDITRRQRTHVRPPLPPRPDPR